MLDTYSVLSTGQKTLKVDESRVLLRDKAILKTL
jgi:hypothetical protein